ncbi:MAG TPA: hypothetical protein VKV26_06630 [Dehalococcoidia bacterium]|nr:hypothetical protein [Dehalococcoidia bacterium]
MPPIEVIRHLAETARARALVALHAVEHSPEAAALEEFARQQALVFAGLLLEELRGRLIAAPPVSLPALLALIEETLAGAAARYEALIGAAAPTAQL